MKNAMDEKESSEGWEVIGRDSILWGPGRLSALGGALKERDRPSPGTTSAALILS